MDKTLDKKIFEFLNSDNHISYSDFENFLISFSLPLTEKWLYYWKGKHQHFDDSEFDDDNLYGFDELEKKLELWQDYLANPDRKEKESAIIHTLIFDQFVIDNNLVERIYVQNGWIFINNRIEEIKEGIEEYENDKAAREHYEHESRKASNWKDTDSYCKACQTSPCMCSDPTGRT